MPTLCHRRVPAGGGPAGTRAAGHRIRRSRWLPKPHPSLRSSAPADRAFFDFGWLKTHHSFSFADYYDPANPNWGALRVFNDDTVLAGPGLRHAPAPRHGDRHLRPARRARAQGLARASGRRRARRDPVHQRGHRRAPQRVQPFQSKRRALRADVGDAAQLRRAAGVRPARVRRRRAPQPLARRRQRTAGRRRAGRAARGRVAARREAGRRRARVRVRAVAVRFLVRRRAAPSRRTASSSRPATPCASTACATSTCAATASSCCGIARRGRRAEDA